MKASKSVHGASSDNAEISQFPFYLDRILSGNDPIVFHYQPIVDLSRGIVAGYEALVRFPAVVVQPPDVCFEIAGQLGKRIDLEEAVSRAALQSRSLLPPNCFLSINMSPAFILSDQWLELLASTPDLSGVVVEITEGELIADYEPIRVRLAMIRSLGGSIAVDDAGAGYASLKHVVEIKPSFIKLDRMFISNCHTDRAKAALIEMIGRVASRLDAWIVAEGIETEPELCELMQLGVPLGQGFYLGYPHPQMQSLPEEKIAHILDRVQAHNSASDLRKYLQPCPVHSSPGSAQSLMAEDLAVDTVVVTDQWNRPVEIVERHPIGGLRRILDIMKIQMLSDPAEVLHRALTRPAIRRFDPFAVIDNQGQFQGIVSIDRLMRAFLG